MALFVVAGAILGSGLGGVQVADRVFMIRLSPPARLGEFFGLYGLVGKGSQVIGQLLYGLILFLLFDTLGNGAYQVAILSLLATMVHRPVAGLAGERPLGRVRRGAARRPHGRGAASAPGPGPAPLEPRARPGVASVAVAGRVRTAPGPGRADHLVQGRAARRPAQDLARPLVGGHQDRRIAGAAGTDRVRDRRADHVGRRGEHLAHREARRGAQVADERLRGALARTRPRIAGAVASSAARCASARSATWM